MLAFELEADGFTHLSCTCKSCGKVQEISFAQIRTKVLDINIWQMTAEQIGEALRCGKCASEIGMTAEPVKGTRTYRGGPVKQTPS